MSNAELQEEEKEVLLSIYEGDEAFIQLTPTTYQYKVIQQLPLIHNSEIIKFNPSSCKKVGMSCKFPIYSSTYSVWRG